MQGRVITSVAAALVAGVMVGACDAGPSQSASARAADCPPGSVRAVVGGRRKCLKPGTRCNKRYESTYRRYGLSCRTGRLVRRKPTTPSLPPGAAVQATIDLGEHLDPIWLAATDGAVWVRSGTGLVRVDPGTNRIVARVTTPPIGFGYVAVGEGAVWQTSYETNSLLRIDPGSNEVLASIPLGDDAAPEGVGVTPGAVWVALHHQGTVARIDPDTNAVVSRVQVGPPGRHGPLKLATGPSGVWVDVPNLGAVVHIDPSTNAVAGKVSPGGVPAVGDHGVWVVAPTSIRRIDSTSNRATTTISLPGTAVDGAAGLGSVWITTSSGLVRIDQETNRIVGKLGIAQGDVAVGAGSVWVAQYDTGRLLRIAPR